MRGVRIRGLPPSVGEDYRLPRRCAPTPDAVKERGGRSGWCGESLRLAERFHETDHIRGRRFWLAGPIRGRVPDHLPRLGCWPAGRRPAWSGAFPGPRNARHLTADDPALGEPHGTADGVLAERFEHLGDNALGVETRLRVHGAGRVL